MQGTSWPPGLDLTGAPLVRRLLLWRGFPRVFQAMTLVIFLTFVVLAWGRYPPADVPLKLYAQCELVNLVLWGLWWPLLMWVVVLFGRAWCAVCPLELVSSTSERVGRSLGLRQAEPGAWSRAGWLALLTFMLSQLLHAAHHALRVPAYTAWFLLALLLLAAVVGLRSRHRSFCRVWCPSTLLLSAFGRGSTLVVRSAPGQDGGPGKGACDSLLDPVRLDESGDCQLCGQCVKVLGPERMRLLLRTPFHRSDARHPLASWPVTLFVISATGFTAKRLFCQTEETWEAAFLWVPQQVAVGVGLPAAATEAIWVCLVFPLALWVLLGLLTVVLRGAESLGLAWRRLALPAAVILAFADMAKTVYKVSSRVRFVPHVIEDPLAVYTPAAIQDGTLSMPEFPIPLLGIALVSLGLLVVGLVYGLREARLARREGLGGRLPALVLLAGFFMALMVDMAVRS